MDKATVFQEEKSVNVMSFQDNLGVSKKTYNLGYIVPKEQSAKIDTKKVDLPKKQIASAKKKSNIIKVVDDQATTELSDESDREELINLVQSIRVNQANLQTLAKHLPIAELDNKAVNRTITQIKV
jgi:hypothetical protein